MVSLRDLVGKKYFHLRKHHILSGEANQAKDVLFLFNGMEKMNMDFRIGATELCSDPNEALPPTVVVVNLLRKYLLPEVRKNVGFCHTEIENPLIFHGTWYKFLVPPGKVIIKG